MHRSLAGVATLALVASAAAQGSFVVPSKAATNQPGAVWYDSAPQIYPLWGTTSSSSIGRAQYLYDVNDIPVPAANLLALGVRAPTGYSIQAATYQTTITVSMGPNAPANASSSFAANTGTGAVSVFSGGLNMPAEVNGPWPRVWQAIPFAQPAPYVAAAGQSLVVDFLTTGSSTQSGWTLEGMRAELGRSYGELYQSSCRNSGGTVSGGWGWQPTGLVPGGTFQLSLSGYPLNTPSLAMNALFIGLTGRGAQVGAFTTPFLLTSLGLPSPAGCQWGIDILGGAGYPMTYRQFSSSAQLEITGIVFPNTPTLAGVNFYTQDLALDMDASGMPSLFPSIAIRWLIGTGATIPCARVGTIGSAVPSAGSVARSEAAVLQLVY